ncbi:hypothetical protein CRG98_006074 [Punica granatum]|uniref:Uncharacterized protein n=1 Tax=Punica granatum TaxID=22663 RepID=A0A2I0KYQ5_PUNGR|nr:hypothetical protein CRG98_006074 [Punica granatum]
MKVARRFECRSCGARRSIHAAYHSHPRLPSHCFFERQWLGEDLQVQLGPQRVNLRIQLSEILGCTGFPSWSHELCSPVDSDVQLLHLAKLQFLPTPQQPPVQGGNGSVAGGIGATIQEGMAFGAGSAVAHRVTDAMLGPQVVRHETVDSTPAAAAAAPAQNKSLGASDACGGQNKALQYVTIEPTPSPGFISHYENLILLFDGLYVRYTNFDLVQCLNSCGTDISRRQFYMDMLQQCRRGSAAALSA